MNITICLKENLCVDCGNQKCLFHGKKESDCPKYKCDNYTHDCENGCKFIDDFIDGVRNK